MKLRDIMHKIGTRVFRKLQSKLGLITLGSRAIVLNAENQVLLVKHTYQPHWYLPGGGIKKGETCKAALIRELREEVGVELVDEPKLFGIYYSDYMRINDYPIIYIAKADTFSDVSSPEIEKMAWFDYERLPDMVSPGTKRRLVEYFASSLQAETW